MTAPSAPAGRRWGIVLAAVAAVGPYVVLKVAWLTGRPWGQQDPGLFAAAPYPQANAITLVLDAAVLVVVAALERPVPRRVPWPVVLAPMWLAGGLLMPVVVGVPVLAPAAVADGVGQAGDPLRGWVYAVVYASLIAQAIVLHVAFARYLHRRPTAIWTFEAGDGSASREAAAAAPPAVRLLIGGALLAVAAAVGQWAVAADLGVAGSGWVPALTAGINGGICLLAAGSALVLVLGAPDRWGRRRRLLLMLVWFATAAMLTWGSYATALGIWAGTGPATLTVSVLRPVAGVLLAAAVDWHLLSQDTADRQPEGRPAALVTKGAWDGRR